MVFRIQWRSVPRITSDISEEAEQWIMAGYKSLVALRALVVDSEPSQIFHKVGDYYGVVE